jgi:hypothetical protein
MSKLSTSTLARQIAGILDIFIVVPLVHDVIQNHTFIIQNEQSPQMKSPSKEITEQMHEAHRRQLNAVGDAFLHAHSQYEALRLKLIRWLFFCTWAKASLFIGTSWCWSVYRSGLSWSASGFLIIWLVIGAVNILKWTLDIKRLERQALTR